MSTNSEKIEENTLKINTVERDFKNLTEKTCPASKERMDKMEAKLESNKEKIGSELKDVCDDVASNEKEIVEVKNSVNLVAHEVKELIVLKNKINSNMWRVILGVIGTLLLYLLLQHGSEIFSKLSIKMGI